MDLFPDLLRPPAPRPPVRGRSIVPDFGPPISDAEMQTRIARRDRALAAFQEACNQFDASNPEPPATWQTWREADARLKQKIQATAAEYKELCAARKAVRDGNCAGVQSV